MTSWFQQLFEYYKNEQETETETKGACVHETDDSRIETSNAGTGALLDFCYKCIKCGRFYE